MSTHREVQGARWPTVACRAQHVAWIMGILEDANVIKPGEDRFPGNAEIFDRRSLLIAYAMLRELYQSDLTNPHLRRLAFKAAILLEKECK